MKLHPCLSTLLLSTATLVACSYEQESTPTGGSAPRASSSVKATTSSGETMDVTWRSLLADLPVAWNAEEPSGSMRLAQYSAGNAATFVVFSFPGGGTVEQNESRWISQFTQPDGSDSGAAVKRSRQERDGMIFSEFDISGTWSGGMSDTGGEGTRFLATIVELPGEMYFLRLTGPQADVAAARADYDAVIASVRRAN